MPAASELSARATTTSVVWLRYSAVERRSSMGVTAARAAAATSPAASVRSRPLAMSAAASTSSMVGPTLPRATTRSATVPSPASVTTAAAWTTEMACARRSPSFTKMPRRPPPSASKAMLVTSSPGSSAVARKPVKNASIGMVRSSLPADETVTSAPSAYRAEMVSLAGLAVTMLPAIVARLRSCGDPTSRQA